MNKVMCPFHDEQTPSCEVYDDSFFCFGCGATGSLDKLAGKAPTFKTAFKKSGKPENLDASLTRISGLPTKVIRGLTLPYDTRGYYIVYPNVPYYVVRRWDAPSANKYIGPFGHKKPLLHTTYGSYTTVDRGPLVVIEGQLNALSTAQSLGYAGPTRTVMSPGAATDFLKPIVLEYCLQYRQICLIVDKDVAGVAAGIQLRDSLVKAGKQVILYPMEIDMNDLLVIHGQARCKEEINKALELFSMQAGTHVPRNEQDLG